MSPRRGRLSAAVRASAPLLLVAACTTVENGSAPSPDKSLDEAVFKCSVEPVLVRQCSYTARHGIAGAALRIYSPGKLRAAPPADIDAAIAPLTAAEHHANFLSASGFKFGTADVLDNLLLRKPLAPSQGGYGHEGGAIFADSSDKEWLAIQAWLSGTGKCP